MRKLLLAGAAALTLTVAAPREAAAELDPGDLNDAIDGLIEFLEEVYLTEIDPGVQVLVARLETLLGLAADVPGGDPLLGYPLTIEESDQFLAEWQKDRAERTEGIDRLSEGYVQAAPAVAQQLTVLEELNRVPQPSLNAQVAIGTQAAIIGASEVSVQTGLIAGLARLTSDQARQEIEDRARAMAFAKARNPDGDWQGVKRWEPRPIDYGF